MAYQPGPNDLLRNARRALRSPSGSGRPMSLQELADAVIAYLHEHAGRTFGISAEHVAALERGKHRWPSAHYRTAFRAVLGADTDAELGFYITRGHATDPAPAVSDASGSVGEVGEVGEVAPSGPTLLGALLVERHWQVYRTFRVHFERAAQELAEREGDPTVRRLGVSERQFRRWLRGDRPHPDACRVLVSMFGHPIDRLIGPIAPGAAVAGAAVAGAAVAGAAVAGASDAPTVEAATGPGTAVAVPDAGTGSAVRVSVTALAGTAVTVVCQDDAVGRVAVVAGGVRVLIDASGADPASLAPAVVDVPAVAGGARLYSLAERRAR